MGKKRSFVAVAIETKNDGSKANPLHSEDGNILRCFVHRNASGRYFAECVDVILIVEKDSPDLAWASLREAIDGYLKVVLAAGQSPEGLFPRPSRWSRRALYHWYVFLAAFRSRERDFRICDYHPVFC